MYKLVVFATLLACAAAAPGLYGAAIAAPISPWGGYSHGYIGAPIVKAPIATSYANTIRVASPALAVAHAPVIAAHAPIVAAPAYAHAW